MSIPWPALVLLVVLVGGCKPAEPPESVQAPQNTEAKNTGDGVPWSVPIEEPTVEKRVRPHKEKAVLPTSSTEIALRYPRSSSPWLGVELRATERDAPGVEIARVVPGSPAAEAQLQAGDILLKMGETTTQNPTEVSAWVRSQAAGSNHPLMILRAGAPKLLRVDLEGTPEFEDRLRLALVGRTAPEVAGVATFQGDASSLQELRGQVVILEFWASYCGACRVLAPVLDEWHRTYRPQGGHVFGITVDPAGKGLQVALKTGMHYTLASDAAGEISRSYLATQIPTVIIIDRSGTVRDVMVGYSTQRLQETEALIQTLLKDKP